MCFKSFAAVELLTVMKDECEGASNISEEDHILDLKYTVMSLMQR